MQLRAGTAMGALILGDVGECERILDEIGGMQHGKTFGGQSVESGTRAELALAKGDVDGGLAAYLAAVDQMSRIRFPGMETSGMEPWTIVAESAALMAHVRYAATVAHEAERDRLAGVLLAKGVRLMRMDNSFLDFPVTGMLLAAVGAWSLAHGGDPRARRTPARAGAPLLLQPDLPGDGLGAAGGGGGSADGPAGSPRSWRSTTADRAAT